MVIPISSDRFPLSEADFKQDCTNFHESPLFLSSCECHYTDRLVTVLQSSATRWSSDYMGF